MQVLLAYLDPLGRYCALWLRAGSHQKVVGPADALRATKYSLPVRGLKRWNEGRWAKGSPVYTPPYWGLFPIPYAGMHNGLPGYIMLCTYMVTQGLRRSFGLRSRIYQNSEILSPECCMGCLKKTLI